ncbi:MAG: hypothetical protein ABIG64_09690 [Candidatus Omnitrophota bacterium]
MGYKINKIKKIVILLLIWLQLSQGLSFAQLITSTLAPQLILNTHLKLVFNSWKTKLSEVIAQVVSLEAHKINNIISGIDKDVLYDAYRRRGNLESKYISTEFKKRWDNDKTAAIYFLAREYPQTHHFLKTGTLFLDAVPPEIEHEIDAGFIKQLILRKKIYNSTKVFTSGHKGAVEWAPFPELNTWLPIQISISKDEKNLSDNPIRTIITKDSKTIIKIGHKITKEFLDSISQKYNQPMYLCGQVSEAGKVNFGRYRKPWGDCGNFYFMHKVFSYYYADLTVDAVAERFHFVGDKKSYPLRIAFLKNNQGEVFTNIESHYSFNEKRIKGILKNIGSFWMKVPVSIATREFNMGAINFGDDNDPFNYYQFNVPFAYVGEIAEVLFDKEQKAPVYLHIPANLAKGTKEISKFLNPIIIPDKNSEFSVTVSAHYNDIAQQALLTAFNQTKKENQKILIGRIPVVNYPHAKPAHRIHVYTKILNIPDEFIPKTQEPLYAEVVFEYLKGKGKKEKPVPAQVRLGYYASNNPLDEDVTTFVELSRMSLSKNPGELILRKSARDNINKPITKKEQTNLFNINYGLTAPTFDKSYLVSKIYDAYAAKKENLFLNLCKKNGIDALKLKTALGEINKPIVLNHYVPWITTSKNQPLLAHSERSIKKQISSRIFSYKLLKIEEKPIFIQQIIKRLKFIQENLLKNLSNLSAPFNIDPSSIHSIYGIHGLGIRKQDEGRDIDLLLVVKGNFMLSGTRINIEKEKRELHISVIGENNFLSPTEDNEMFNKMAAYKGICIYGTDYFLGEEPSATDFILDSYMSLMYVLDIYCSRKDMPTINHERIYKGWLEVVIGQLKVVGIDLDAEFLEKKVFNSRAKFDIGKIEAQDEIANIMNKLLIEAKKLDVLKTIINIINMENYLLDEFTNYVHRDDFIVQRKEKPEFNTQLLSSI